MTLPEQLAALRTAGATSATFFSDGSLRHIEIAYNVEPPQLELEAETRATMSLPGEVTQAGQPGPQVPPSVVRPGKPPVGDPLRDIILSDLSAPPALTSEDLPDGDEDTDETGGPEARDVEDTGGGEPRPGPGEAQ